MARSSIPDAVYRALLRLYPARFQEGELVFGALLACSLAGMAAGAVGGVLFFAAPSIEPLLYSQYVLMPDNTKTPAVASRDRKTTLRLSAFGLMKRI